MMNEESASTAVSNQPSAIGKLLDMLIKHGTLPNVPIPEWIIDAQAELADLQVIKKLYSMVCVNIQEFIHEDGREIGYGGENVDELLIEYARELEARLQRVKADHETIIRQITGWDEEYGLHNMNLAIESTKQDAAYAKGWNECRHEMARWLKQAAALHESES